MNPNAIILVKKLDAGTRRIGDGDIVRQALSDLRVVELGAGVAAGWCGKAFADLGADVLKVEPPEGDPLRADFGMFAHLHANKRSVVIDVAPANVATLYEVIAGVDLVIETPGYRSLADWGISRDGLMASTRSLTILAITGFGTTGPYADYAWSDLTAQAFSGTIVMDQRGPIKLPMSLGEAAVGHTAALGALAAVERARATGVGPRSSIAPRSRRWRPAQRASRVIWDGSTAVGRRHTSPLLRAATRFCRSGSFRALTATSP
jgi:crotonobetainyl-CoA:carnitine CoA-transferase CaiB-like acyl-CoA transferase